MGTQDGFTTAWCESISALQPGDVPESVRSALTLFMLDTIGVIAGAQGSPGLAALASRYERWESGGTATALLTGARLSPPTAALLNGTAAHALDYDDQHDAARVHSNCVVLPALLAIAQDLSACGRPVSGKRFLHALAVGLELHARLGLCCYSSLAHGWHPTMTFGALSGAIAGGVLLGLDAGKLGDALGIALHQASGSAQSARDGVLAKRVGAGFAARAAVTSAYLAADGITGTRRTLEGTAGLFELYERGVVRPELLTEGLWSDWRVLEYSLKPYPCCRCNHGAMDHAVALHGKGVRAEDVAGIDIHLGALNHLTVGGPYDAARNHVVVAQFSVAYGFAAALVHGRVGLENYRVPGITDPALVALTRRIRTIEDASMDANAIEPSRVRVFLKSGEVLERVGTQLKGSPQAPMSTQEVDAKFEDCLTTGFGADAAAVKRLRSAIVNIAECRDVGLELAEAFPQGTGRRSVDTAGDSTAA
jgi:2-methylcitrate dehydratase PrpD